MLRSCTSLICASSSSNSPATSCAEPHRLPNLALCCKAKTDMDVQGLPMAKAFKTFSKTDIEKLTLVVVDLLCDLLEKGAMIFTSYVLYS